MSITNPALFNPLVRLLSYFEIEKYSQNDLAQYFKVNQGLFSRILRGQRKMSMEMMVKISSYLEIDSGILIRLSYIESAVNMLLKAHPELVKFQKELYEEITKEAKN